MRPSGFGVGNHHSSRARPKRSVSTDFTWLNSCRPSGPCTRPMPDSFTPPKGSAGTPYETITSLMHTLPASRPAASRSAWAASADPHRRVEAVGRVVGQAQRLVGAAHLHDRQHRPERLVAHDGHVVVDVDQHRGLVPEPVAALDPAPAGEHPRAALDRVRDVALDDVELGREGHRADVVADRRALADRARAGHARVRRTARRPPRRRRPARRDMHVWPEFWNAPHTAPAAARSRSASSHTIIGSLPPSSSSTGVKVSAAAAMTRLPVRAEPVKQIFCTPGAHQCLTRGAATGDDLHEVGMAADRGEQITDQAADERRDLRRLQHDGVAGEGGGDDRGHGEDERVVPGADHADHTQRLVTTLGPLVSHEPRRDPLRPQRPLAVLGVVGDRLARRHDLGEHGFGTELAGLGGDRVDDLVQAVEHDVADRKDVFATLAVRQAAPVVERAPGPLDGGGHVERAHVGHRADGAPGAGIDALDDARGGDGHDGSMNAATTSAAGRAMTARPSRTRIGRCISSGCSTSRSTTASRVGVGGRIEPELLEARVVAHQVGGGRVEHAEQMLEPGAVERRLQVLDDVEVEVARLELAQRGPRRAAFRVVVDGHVGHGRSVPVPARGFRRRPDGRAGGRARSGRGRGRRRGTPSDRTRRRGEPGPRPGHRATPARPPCS